MARTREDIQSEVASVKQEFASLFDEFARAVKEGRQINPKAFADDCFRLIGRHIDLERKRARDAGTSP